MGSENVVELAGRRPLQAVREYAVLFRLKGQEVQFKVFDSQLTADERKEMAIAFEAAAAQMRMELPG